MPDSVASAQTLRATTTFSSPSDAPPEALLVSLRRELRRLTGSRALTAMAEAATPTLPAPVVPRQSVPDRPETLGPPQTVAAVLTSFNKLDWVRKNLAALQRQTVPFDKIIVVDNNSSDGSADMVRSEFPGVHLIVMPHSQYGACETFNIGFKNAQTDFIAILDDDVELSEDWLELTLARMAAEPPTTAMISTKVIEPGEPEWYTHHPEVNRERYMATFRGCATLARRDVLEACGYYDEAFFIYGNERDLSARVMNAGYRILQYPKATCRHGTPFGMKGGPRSLYYHVRNLWWYLFKHVALRQIAYFFVIQLMLKVGLRRESIKADAIGTIGIYQVIRETPRGWWIVCKATLAAFAGLPRCLRQRRVCVHPDFSLPTK
jgi:hypothetical protein